jgi:hypothetical protein
MIRLLTPMITPLTLVIRLLTPVLASLTLVIRVLTPMISPLTPVLRVLTPMIASLTLVIRVFYVHTCFIQYNSIQQNVEKARGEIKKIAVVDLTMAALDILLVHTARMDYLTT